jgi:transcriptional regulator with XRE-family HTH domain
MSSLARKVGVRIQQLRKSQKLTQAEFAENTDLSVDYIGSIERGDRTPSLGVLERISEALDISLKDLFDFPEEEIPSRHEKLVTMLNGFIKKRSADDIELILDLAKRIFERKTI